MTITELGAIGEFIGGIVVIVTLIYLIFQLRQNTQSIRSQSRFSVLETLNADMRQVQTPEHQELQLNVLSGEASENDRTRWAFVLLGWLSHNEMLFYEIEDEAIPRDFESTLRWRLLTIIAAPGAMDTWNLYRGAYTERFQNHVDSVIATASDAELEERGRGYGSVF